MSVHSTEHDLREIQRLDGEIERLRAERNDALRALRNLMAVINRDGGHRASEFATDAEAAQDCQATVIRERQALEQALAKVQP